jgi:hypothetical protein
VDWHPHVSVVPLTAPDVPLTAADGPGVCEVGEMLLNGGSGFRLWIFGYIPNLFEVQQLASLRNARGVMLRRQV